MKQTAVLLLLGLLACQSMAKSYDNADEQDTEERESSRVQDPCASHECGTGYECEMDESEKPTCVCIRQCPDSATAIKVCNTQNVTFSSECEFHRQKCLCHQKKTECIDRKFRKGHLDYYGACKELTPCLEQEMTDFPHRMRQWLYLVMEELDKRNDLSEGAHRLMEEAKLQEHHWVLPVIWKFCDLDTTHDSFVNPHELMPITAPLKPLEHCTGPFLEHCDANDDGHIDLKEWGKCLQLDEEEIEDRCEEMKN